VRELKAADQDQGARQCGTECGRQINLSSEISRDRRGTSRCLCYFFEGAGVKKMNVALSWLKERNVKVRGEKAIRQGGSLRRLDETE